MTGYSAPVRDMRFVLDELADLAGLARLPGYEEATPDLVEAVLEEAGKLASEVLAPLNQSGDREGVTLENGVVRTPTGFPEAYARFVEGGWGSLAFDPDYGGQGLPWTLAIAVQEMWNSANLSFALAPVLTQGTVELLQTHGTEAQKATYLPKLISGAWTGTMELTEPQAGSDVGALKTRAVANGDHYLITGQKIFITWGEHDCAENIVHMVLARTPDAPAGTKGLSVFIVPKFLPGTDGAPGARNDLRCVSLEDKLGIHASPTCVMAYGDSGGAVGYLMGEENRGMACMFTMMNNARVLIGLEGLAIGERAYQAALAYAKERVQSHAIGDRGRGGDPVPIIRHPDVRRMLMTMKATNEAMRGLIYTAAAALDTAKRHPDAGVRAAAQARIDLMTPVVKAWLSDSGCEVASLGVQVHGGMGYIEETGAAQYYRDVRIACIYEGTNGIQALDLLTRKLLRDQGAAVGTLLAEMAATLGELKASGNADGLSEALAAGVESLAKTTDWLLETGAADLERAAAGATPYLRLFGTVAGGWLLARGALAATRRLAGGGETEDRPFLEAKVATARFYADNILPRAAAEAAAVTRGADSTLALDEARF